MQQTKEPRLIHNQKTGQQLRVLKSAADTDGALLEMEATYQPHSPEPPSHYHPYQEEEFVFLSGELMVRIFGEVHTFRQGDVLHVPAKKVHSMWNEGDQPATVLWRVWPALDTEEFLAAATGLANEGKTNQQGKPALMEGAALGRKYAHVFRLASPPFLVQRVLFLVVVPVGMLVRLFKISA